jgi:CubicO group peptidase (beta-lactamase class C family)
MPASPGSVGDLADSIDRVAAATGFSGVVRVDRDGELVCTNAYGFANRAYERPNSVDTQFGLASGTKGLTALTIASLMDEGRLELATSARSVLGGDLPLVADDVTVEHLLAHRSGIGDYMDEDELEDVTDYVLAVPAQELSTTEAYVPVLDGFPTKFAAGTEFSYCNGGYVVLALMAERVTGIPFADLVSRRVCAPAGMVDTAFLRSDELPGDAAVGYLDAAGARTNVFHLPVLGSGDGGIFSTAADIHTFWGALFGGRIVPTRVVAEMVRPRSVVASEGKRYGLGFWLHASSAAVILVGSDAGVSFQTVHDPAGAFTYTVLSNTTKGAWPVARLLDELHRS